MNRPMIALLIVCWFAAPQAIADQEATWPQWRGPTRDGLVANSVWPSDLSHDRFSEKWRVELAPSYSGPIVVGGRVFVTETQDQEREVVQALDRDTGRSLWKTEWEGAMSVPFFARSNGSWIRSTPAYDEGRLYVAGMRDVLVCLDAQTGDRMWGVDFTQQLGTPVPSFGFVCSPLVDGDYIYVQAAGAVLKLDKRNGQVIWSALRDGGGMNGSAFSSPMLAELHGKQRLLVQTRTTLASIDPETGDVEWEQEIPAFRGMNIVTPTVYQNSVFTSSYGGKSFLFRVLPNGAGLGASEAWTNKAQGYMSTPVIIDGHAYLHLRNQRFTCIDLATGETKWTTQPYGKYWSMVANADRILALDQRGEILLIHASPEKFDLVDSRQLTEEETWAHLAVVGDEVFVRELNAMAVYRWSESRRR